MRPRGLFYETVDGAEDLAHKSLCMVLINTGCGISEALSLRLENSDHSEKALVFKTLKQRGEERTRALSVPDELIDLLLQQAASGLGSRVWKFTRWTGWRIVKKYMAQAELYGAKGTPKGLRHALAIDNPSIRTSTPPKSTLILSGRMSGHWPVGRGRIGRRRCLLSRLRLRPRSLKSRALSRAF
jgi:integrase/recombinase XerD